MALNPLALGTALAAAAGSTDAPGKAAWSAIAAAIVTWVPANTQVTATGSSPLIATAAVVSGKGAILLTGSASILGASLAVAAAATDAQGIAAWAAIGNAIGAWIVTGGVNPSGLVGYTGVGTGAVGGTGALAFTSDAPLANAAGSTDAAGMAVWAAIASAITTHLSGATVTPTMTNPGTGGALAGTGAIA